MNIDPLHMMAAMQKDYLTLPEAAFYCCVSEAQFKAKRDEYGIHPIRWMGKRVYPKRKLDEMMSDAQWQESTGEGEAPTLRGSRTVGNVASLSGGSRSTRPRMRDRLKS